MVGSEFLIGLGCYNSSATLISTPASRGRARVKRGVQLLHAELRSMEREAEQAAPRHNIPHPMTRFIGRESEIGEVRRLLARHRLVTLTGVGGMGKSRLAMELGRAMALRFAGLGARIKDDH